MFIEGRLEADLIGGIEKTIAPAGIFGGLINLITEFSWEHHEKVEATDCVRFAHSVHLALVALGCNRIIRVALGERVVFENKDNHGDHFAEALGALDRIMLNDASRGLELNLFYSATDALLNYVVDVSFTQVHKARKPGVVIIARAVPTGLRRKVQESEASYSRRVASARIPGIEALEHKMEDFLRRLLIELQTRQLLQLVKLQSKRKGAKVVNIDRAQSQVWPGKPLYGFDPYFDLSYFWLYKDIRDARVNQTNSGSDGGYSNWSSDDPLGFDAGFCVGDFIGDAMNSGGFDGGDSGGDGGGGDGGGGGGD